MPLFPAPLDVKYTYRYSGDKIIDGKRCAIFKVKMEFKDTEYAPASAPYKPTHVGPQYQSGMPTYLRLKSYKGKLVYDIKGRQLKSTESESRMIMGLKMPPNTRQLWGYTAEMDIKIKTKTELTKTEGP